ncbi:hypothetical protein D9O40_06735 [Clostridium autoethanogenum]|uniref:Flagellin n=1 Tax=Clostridium autoethanogenum TaxID=84023 RepID=A0A3M0SVA6_9CLOT|nr:flagellin [Clostridium autoethanogenum]RMD02327.1 hypothetical protein D9O40_06735 [Clostridium autoethanogenum]
MIIAHNINAIAAANKLKKSRNNVSKAMEKISSGLRINGAFDDAAGLSISEKMRGQIGGLQMASENIQNGVSLIQTAEGGLSSIIDPPLQRMRKIAVQAANGTLTDSDRDTLQQEFDQMKDSIDTIANNTEFNGIKLLNLEPIIKSTVGENSNVQKPVLKSIDWDYVSDNINFTADDIRFNKEDGKYVAENGGDIAYSIDGVNWIETDNNQFLSGINFGKGTYIATGGMSNSVGRNDGGFLYSNDGINWSNSINISPHIDLSYFGTEQNAVAYDGNKFVVVGKYNIGDFKIITSNDGVNWNVHNNPNNIGFICYGNGKYVGTGYNSIFTSNDGVNWVRQGSLQLYTMSYGHSEDSVVYEGNKYFIFGECNSSILVSDDGANWNEVRVAGDTSINYKFSSIAYDGNQYFAIGVDGYGGKTVIYNSDDGVNWSLEKELHSTGSIGNPKIIWDGKRLVVSEKDGFTFGTPKYENSLPETNNTDNVETYEPNIVLQVGANSGQTMKINLCDVRASSIGVSKLSIETRSDAENAVSKIDNAIQIVSSHHSRMGAYEVSLGHTLNNVENYDYNITSAESRIRDIDIAKEMMEVVKNDVLAQAAEAVLGQTNEEPQDIVKMINKYK